MFEVRDFKKIMKNKNILFLIVITFLLSATALAQSSSSVVKVTAGSAKVKRGGSAVATVTLDISDGYHINSNRPGDANLRATQLKIEPLTGFTFGAVTYPKAKSQKFAFSPKPLSVFEGKAVLKFTVRASASAGSQTAKGKLSIQACNNEVCLRPQTVDVSIPIEVN